MSELTESLQHIGKNIRKMRKYRGMTLQQVSEITGLRPATIGDIENGSSNWTVVSLLKIASALKCQLDIIIQPYDE